MGNTNKYTGLIFPVFGDMNLLKNQNYLEENSIRYKIVLESESAFLIEIDVFDFLTKGISINTLINTLINTEDKLYKNLIESDFGTLLNPGIYISGFDNKKINYWNNSLIDKLINIRNFYSSKTLKFTIGVKDESLIFNNYPSEIGREILLYGENNKDNIDELLRFVRSTKNITSEFILDILFDLVSGVFRKSERLESAVIDTIYNYSKNRY